VLSGQEQYGAPATSQVQDSLVTPKSQAVEQFGPNQELASKRGVEVEADNGQHEQGRQKLPHVARDDCDYEAGNDHDCAGCAYESERIGGVNPVRTTTSRFRLFGHGVPFIGNGDREFTSPLFSNLR
jgi:hypothetical protein